MNGIQKYLIETALIAAREAAGALIATSELSPVLVAQSLEELTQVVNDCVGSTESKVSCDWEYEGRSPQWPDSSSRTALAAAPIFVQPTDKS